MKRGVLTRILILDAALLTLSIHGTLQIMHMSRSPLAIMVLKATDPAGQDYQETRRKDIADPR